MSTIDTSGIDATKPTATSATTSSVRDNFTAIIAQFTNAASDIDLKAPLASPAFTGNATFGGNVSLGDSNYLYLGASNDFFAVHDGANLNLRNTTGIFYLENLVNSSDLRIYTNNSVGTAKQCAAFGGATPYVRLYYDGVVKLSTDSNGIVLPENGRYSIGDAGEFLYGSNANSLISIYTNGTEQFRVDNNATGGETRFMIYDVDNATLERVTVGAADSGGAGYKVLRIPN